MGKLPPKDDPWYARVGLAALLTVLVVWMLRDVILRLIDVSCAG